MASYTNFYFSMNSTLISAISHKNFLSDRTFQVIDTLSNQFQMVAGTTQWSVLSPFLADLPSPQIFSIKRICFADNILVYYTHPKTRAHLHCSFNNYLDEIHSFFKRWKIKLNTDKCEGIIIIKRQYKMTARIQIRLNQHDHITFITINI